MHIRKLEISGFKSFVDRTHVHFDHDVLAIVGPNGCGKSNIVDAIRWCMGEQNARHLRGKSMEDVIFNGSETRGPLGMAEVTLIFDNSDLEQAASLPVEYRDYPEIAVTRRLFRDGTSQYLLNKTEVRLKDVVDVFLGTGVGSKAYSIVEQGKIGLIVSARPEDRRALIEEAAGITKYKSRKNAAERKMELTEQNLLRVGDRVGELERSVASLQRQAAKAERYVSYRHELDQLMLHQASHQFLEIAAQEKFWEVERAAGTMKVEAARTALETGEVELEVLRADALDLESTAERAQNEAFARDNQVRALQAEISRQKDRLVHLKERFDAARAEEIDLREKAEAISSECSETHRFLEQLEAEEAKDADVVLTEQQRLEGLQAEERTADTVISDLRAGASAAASQVAAATAKLAGLERRTGEMRARETKLGEDLSALSAQRQGLESHRAELATQLARLESDRRATLSERGDLEQKLDHLRQALVESEGALEISRGELARQRARLAALEDMRARLEGVGEGVKHLMAKGDPTLLALVVDRIQAPAELTVAVASLLGELLQCVVVDDVGRAFQLLAELARDKKGRASIIPRSPRRADRKEGEPLEGPGVIGPLLDRLACAPEDQALVAALVDDAVLVEDARHALELSSRAGGRTLVALDGTVVYPDGRVCGGSGDSVASELVDEQRQMRDLRTTCAAMLVQVDAEVAAHQKLRDEMAQLGATLDQARQNAHQTEIALASAHKDEKKTAEQVASAEHRLASVSTELSEIGQKLAEGGHEQAEAERALFEGEAALREMEAAADSAAATAAAWREQVAAQLSVVTEKKVRLARVREQVASTRAATDRLERSRDELAMRISRLEQDLDEVTRHTAETTAQQEETSRLASDAARAAQAAEAALSEARRLFDHARSVLGERELSLKGLRAASSEASETLASHERTLERLVMSRGHLVDSVREKFRGLDLLRVVGDYHMLASPDEEHLRRVSELSLLIDRMGPVNLDATREHREEKARLVFYTEQKADLEKALEDLRRAIARMNRESRRLFRETFESVNERFKVLFPKMFNGGRGELHLTDPEELLETGIEIVAQPPGKKLGNIELMSGGEKALTAVSLIFAIFQHKPSPFCILDEVDAPLDDANVGRYNELIREMTHSSQFILVTHVKRTMQSVDVLYGVTMQEPGISRLVSVKVNESAQRRSGVPGIPGDRHEVQVA